MIMSDKESKRIPLNWLEDLDVHEVSLVAAPAIGRTYLLMKAADDPNTETVLFSDEELEEYLNANVDAPSGTSIEKAATKREQGYDFPAVAYAYVPDPDKPSTWKLRLWETPDKKITARQVGMAVAALGKGFRGQKVQIPGADLGKVKAKVRAAWKQVHEGDEEMPAVLKGVDNMDEKLEGLLKGKELPEEVSKALDTILTAKIPVEIMKEFYGLAGYEIPIVEKTVEVEKVVEKIVEVEKAAVDPKEAILKGLSPDALNLYKAQEAELEVAKKATKDAQDKAEVEKQARTAQEYVVKAAEFSTLGDTPENLGPVLQAVDTLAKPVADRVKAIFKQAVDNIIARKDVIDPGASKASTDEPEYLVKAKAMVAKGEAKSENLAIALLVDREPELFNK